jgi:hypothetical protein
VVAPAAADLDADLDLRQLLALPKEERLCRKRLFEELLKLSNFNFQEANHLLSTARC